MKRIFWILSIPIAVLSAPACNNAVKTEAATAQHTLTVSPAAIDGSWELVWEKVGDRIRNNAKNTQFKIFHDGFFSLIALDSSGKWSWDGAGTYSLEGNTYKETFRYSSVPEYIGATDWQEYELKGDTLITRGFIKVIFADGQNKTSVYPAFEEKRVRAKR